MSRYRKPRKPPMPTLEQKTAYLYWAEHVLPLESARLKREIQLQRYWSIARRLAVLALYALFTAAFLRAFLK